jgi:hypothetical protein
MIVYSQDMDKTKEKISFYYPSVPFNRPPAGGKSDRGPQSSLEWYPYFTTRERTIERRIMIVINAKNIWKARVRR